MYTTKGIVRELKFSLAYFILCSLRNIVNNAEIKEEAAVGGAFRGGSLLTWCANLKDSASFISLSISILF